MPRHRPQRQAQTLSSQALRYAVASAVAFACDYATLFALTEYASFHYLISAACGFILGSAIVYILSIFWVFRRRSGASRRKEFLLFLAIGLVGLAVNILAIRFFTDTIGLHYMISKIIAAALTLSLNFIGRRTLLFTAR